MVSATDPSRSDPEQSRRRRSRGRGVPDEVPAVAGAIAGPSGVRARGLQHRFRALWLARWISSIGDGLVLVAFPLLATTVTRDPILISGVAFAATVPWLVFALPAGAIADRVSRRSVIVGVETARAGAVLALATAIATHHLGIVE